MPRPPFDPLGGPEEAAAAARAEQEEIYKEAEAEGSRVPEALRRMEAEAEAGSEEAEGPQMVIGGVSLSDLQNAHAQHPTLARWHETSLRLIPDLYEVGEQARGKIAALEQHAAAQAAEIKELRQRLTPGSGEGDEPKESST